MRLKGVESRGLYPTPCQILTPHPDSFASNFQLKSTLLLYTKLLLQVPTKNKTTLPNCILIYTNCHKVPLTIIKQMACYS